MDKSANGLDIPNNSPMSQQIPNKRLKDSK